jgi:hypothetical protein
MLLFKRDATGRASARLEFAANLTNVVGVCTTFLFTACADESSFVHATCSLEGARSVLACIAFTRSAADAPSSDSP